ncbi:hypothetical protein CLV30_10191 [Haloactinopolyspora alba]|uniref:Uncharacterized protein n=1 Tax=Haloactinopolyspora alba TaxID=648780 RepID=A0A2P8EFB1_9ACTN|nr:hypothetical protein [Haloactinopolyspora alba]PSL08124.1 hypothetical protein CLV30_10191 [Haloactinopolyspora alba]
MRLESGTGRLCGQLRADMYQDGNGTWYNARITVDEQRQVTVEFDYDTPPFGGVIDETDPDGEGDADPELLLEDHRMYPRSPDLVPTRHPVHDETCAK